MLFLQGMRTLFMSVVRFWYLTTFGPFYCRLLIVLPFFFFLLFKVVFESVIFMVSPFFCFSLRSSQSWFCHVMSQDVVLLFRIRGKTNLYMSVVKTWPILHVWRQQITQLQLCPVNVAFMCISACWSTFHMSDSTCIPSHMSCCTCVQLTWVRL